MSDAKHSIKEIQDGVQRLINSHFHQEPSARMRIPASRDDDDLMVSDAIKELAALRIENAAQSVWIKKAKIFLVASTDVYQSISIDEARALLADEGQATE